MLNNSQQLTVRVAVRRARENGTEAEEIKKLAAGMHISEAEIRACADSALGAAPAKQRMVWTPQMVERLTALHDEGMGPTAIAGKMGLKVPQVQFKLCRLKLKTVEPEKPTPNPAPSTAEPLVLVEPAAVLVQETSDEQNASPSPIPFSGGGEFHETLIDMPAALLFLIRLVHENYGDKVIRVHASNDEHCAACAFEADGVEYDLKLEVLEK